MGDRSAIEWTDASWNPIRGCTRVSEGCRNCYAERQAIRQAGPGGAYEGLVTSAKQRDRGLPMARPPRGPFSKPRWTGELRFVPEALELPLRWRTRRRIFVNSMSDLFHEKVEDEWIDRIFAVMALAARHQFQVLTKRPERMAAYMASPLLTQRLIFAIRSLSGDRLDGAPPLPLPNVWLGVSVEDQATADARIPWLLRTPAAVRFVSYEPALGPVDFGWAMCSCPWKADAFTVTGPPRPRYTLATPGIRWPGGSGGPVGSGRCPEKMRCGAYVLHVGDDPVLAVEGARGAGMRVIQVTTARPPWFGRHRPEATIPGLAALPEAVARLERRRGRRPA